MNETERAALVEELAEAYYNANPITMCDAITDDGAEINRRGIKWDDLSLVQQAGCRQRFYREFLFAMPIIDRLLTTRTVPTVDDDAVERAAKAFHNSYATPWWDESHTWDGVQPETYRQEVRDRMRLVLEAAPEPEAVEEPEKRWWWCSYTAMHGYSQRESLHPAGGPAVNLTILPDGTIHYASLHIHSATKPTFGEFRDALLEAAKGAGR